MALLTNEQRRELWGDFMTWLSREGITVQGFGKAAVRTTVDNLDAFFDSTSTQQTILAEFDTAMRPGANFPKAAKAKLISMLLEKRWVEDA